MSRVPPLHLLTALAILMAGSCIGRADTTGSDLILAGPYDTTTNAFDSTSVINQVDGASIFYNAGYYGEGQIIGNVEGGLIWDGQEVFDRTALDQDTGLDLGPTVSLTSSIAVDPVSAPDAGQLDFHATMVGNVLAGTGYTGVTINGVPQFSALGAGMDPEASLWSGAIATSYSSTDIGSFSISQDSFLTPYKAFFNGTMVNGVLTKPGVINSSWGSTDSPGTNTGISSGTDYDTMTIDALARQNPTVAFVAAAGNGGPSSVAGAATVGSPGSGFNGITVGSLGPSTGSNAFMTPSSFTSSGPIDFYNPETGQTLTGVRAGVDIAAPGEDFALAAYLGPTGSLQSDTSITDPSLPTDQYFVNEDGTSFAAPQVAGGIALLKNVAETGPYGMNLTTAEDSRVIKSVLMAGATATIGWNNGQTLQNGVIRTTQALDYSTGAGALNLTNAALIYVGGTQDVVGLAGGTVAPLGWDYGELNLHGTNTYNFNQSFLANTQLTISLNWFVNQSFDNTTNVATEESFANLNLHLYLMVGGTPELVAESLSVYNNTQFLRLDLTQGGLYEMTVTYDDELYDVTGNPAPAEDYGLAWDAIAMVPEPSVISLLALSAPLIAFIYIRRRKSKTARPL